MTEILLSNASLSLPQDMQKLVVIIFFFYELHYIIKIAKNVNKHAYIPYKYEHYRIYIWLSMRKYFVY